MAKSTVIGSESGTGGDSGEPISTVVDIGDDGGAAIPIVEPATISGEPESEGESTGKRKRGRPRGSTSATSKSVKQEAQDLTGVLLSLHMMAAAIAKTPELELEENEAKRLGEAVARVNACYGGWVFTEKQMAWFNLFMAGGAIYGPRCVAWNLRMRKIREEKTVDMPAPTIN